MAFLIRSLQRVFAKKGSYKNTSLQLLLRCVPSDSSSSAVTIERRMELMEDLELEASSSWRLKLAENKKQESFCGAKPEMGTHADDCV